MSIYASEKFDPKWKNSANCVGMDEAIFNTPDNPDYVKLAKIACAGCAVRGTCLDVATTFGVKANQIWGGMIKFERDAFEYGRRDRDDIGVPITLASKIE